VGRLQGEPALGLHMHFHAIGARDVVRPDAVHGQPQAVGQAPQLRGDAVLGGLLPIGTGRLDVNGDVFHRRLRLVQPAPHLVGQRMGLGRAHARIHADVQVGRDGRLHPAGPHAVHRDHPGHGQGDRFQFAGWHGLAVHQGGRGLSQDVVADLADGQ